MEARLFLRVDVQVRHWRRRLGRSIFSTVEDGVDELDVGLWLCMGLEPADTSATPVACIDAGSIQLD